jgi:DNA-binding MarR family transcriptional regulator
MDVEHASAATPPVERDPVSGWPTGRLLSTAARLVEHAWIDALDKLGVSHAGLIVLHLLEASPATQKCLARRARVEDQTMSRTVERLERDGLVQRAPDPDDRRRRIVELTEEGRAVWSAAGDLEAQVFPAVTDPGALRAALLEVIVSSEAQRWTRGPEPIRREPVVVDGPGL